MFTMAENRNPLKADEKVDDVRDDYPAKRLKMMIQSYREARGMIISGGSGGSLQCEGDDEDFILLPREEDEEQDENFIPFPREQDEEEDAKFIPLPREQDEEQDACSSENEIGTADLVAAENDHDDLPDPNNVDWFIDRTGAKIV